jgi:hypothetical protein
VSLCIFIHSNEEIKTSEFKKHNNNNNKNNNNARKMFIPRRMAS